MNNSGKIARADVLIAGAGYAGLALAAALARAGLDVALADPAVVRPAPQDPRAFALVPGSRRLLEAVGAWDTIARGAEPVRRMEVSDARLSEVLRPVLLHFDAPDDVDPVAHIAPSPLIRAALFDAAKAAGVRTIPAAVSSYEATGNAVRAELSDGSSLAAALLVGAEGAQSPLRRMANIRTYGWRYDQAGIVTAIEFEHPHEGVAVQHFLEGGPFALLPLPGNRASVVWSERRLNAERLYALPDAEFRAALQARAGGRFGEIALAGPRAMRPLSLQVAANFVAPRLALIGDAAHVTHPIAGQGLNLGFRDVAALAEVIADAARLGGDIGLPDVLTRYESWRRFDTMLMLGAMDSLLKLFLLRSSPARIVRDAGMAAFDRLPGVKAKVMISAAGLSGDVPRLMRGEAL